MWKPVVGFEGSYEVSSLGRVRSLDRLVRYRRATGEFYSLKRGQLLAQNLINSGYLVVHLHLDGERSIRLVHRLVAESFHGRRADDEVNHRDFNTLNNREGNLHWCTHLENVEHSAQHRHEQGNVVKAVSADGTELKFRSQAKAEIALLGKMTGIVSWALKHGKPAIGYTWSRV